MTAAKWIKYIGLALVIASIGKDWVPHSTSPVHRYVWGVVAVVGMVLWLTGERKERTEAW